MNSAELIKKLRAQFGRTDDRSPSPIEAPAWPPHRELPQYEDRGPELARFRAWVRRHEKLKVKIVSNLVLSLGDSLRMSSTEQVYRSLEPSAFAAFQKAKASIPYVLPHSLELVCSVRGTIRTYIVPGEGNIDITIEDLLLHSFAYRQHRSQLLDAQPDWVPFFFRGGIPPGMAAVGDAFFANYAGGLGQLPALKDYTWMPGLTHDLSRVGTSPATLFLDDLERRMENCPQATFRLWVIDTSFTGSTALSSLIGALGRARVPAGKSIAVTVALFLPLRENLLWSGTQEDHTVLDTSIRATDGSRALLRKVTRPPTVASMEVRVFPLQRSLTEDDERMLELTYLLPPNKRLPVYGIGKREQVHVNVGSSFGKTIIPLLIRAEDRGDTLHDWFFNAFNPRRLRQLLGAFNLPLDVVAAEASVIARAEAEPVRKQGVLVPIQ